MNLGKMDLKVKFFERFQNIIIIYIDLKNIFI